MRTGATISDSTVPVLAHGVRLAFDSVRGEWVLLAPERVFPSDEVATDILKRIDGRATVAEIVAQLAGIYDVELAVLDRDVREFLTDLVDKEILVL
jgi:pyrroloquinoline quinone biosynthesis protein D